MSTCLCVKFTQANLSSKIFIYSLTRENVISGIRKSVSRCYSKDIRNIARLPQHVRSQMRHALSPPTAEQLSWHPTWHKQSFQRRLVAKYGNSSGISPGVCWPAKDTMEELIEDEKEWETSLQEMMNIIADRKKIEEEERQNKEALVAKQMARMPQYIAEMKSKEMKRQEEEKKADEKRRLLLDEAREYFGFNIDPKDPRFKQMQEMKEEEEKLAKKKRKKEERKAQQSIKIDHLAKSSSKAVKT